MPLTSISRGAYPGPDMWAKFAIQEIVMFTDTADRGYSSIALSWRTSTILVEQQRRLFNITKRSPVHCRAGRIESSQLARPRL